MNSGISSQSWNSERINYCASELISSNFVSLANQKIQSWTHLSHFSNDIFLVLEEGDDSRWRGNLLIVVYLGFWMKVMNPRVRQITYSNFTYRTSVEISWKPKKMKYLEKKKKTCSCVPLASQNTIQLAHFNREGYSWVSTNQKIRK